MHMYAGEDKVFLIMKLVGHLPVEVHLNNNLRTYVYHTLNYSAVEMQYLFFWTELAFGNSLV